MENEINVEWLLILQEALLEKDWDSETAVINHVNRISNVKVTDPKQVNQAIILVSEQMKHNYPLRCFME